MSDLVITSTSTGRRVHPHRSTGVHPHRLTRPPVQVDASTCTGRLKLVLKPAASEMLKPGPNPDTRKRENLTGPTFRFFGGKAPKPPRSKPAPMKKQRGNRDGTW
jgi:hypothetical protein